MIFLRGGGFTESCTCILWMCKSMGLIKSSNCLKITWQNKNLTKSKLIVFLWLDIKIKVHVYAEQGKKIPKVKETDD